MARINPFVLAAASVFWLYFGINEISQRLLIEVEGTIVSSDTTTGNRPATFYKLRSSDGNQREYVAGCTDQSLTRRLPAGTYINKKKYDLSWEKDGQIVSDFPLGFYLGASGIGTALGILAFLAWRARQARDRAPRS
jgi:hypothetical protein